MSRTRMKRRCCCICYGERDNWISDLSVRIECDANLISPCKGFEGRGLEEVATIFDAEMCDSFSTSCIFPPHSGCCGGCVNMRGSNLGLRENLRLIVKTKQNK